MSNLIVSKFGGVALSNSEMVKKTIEIIKSDPDRKYIVVSSPGKRSNNDIKVTDLLYRCHTRYTKKENFADTLAEIQARFAEIISGLGIDFDLQTEMDSLKNKLFTGKSKDYIASRGEHIMAKILAKLLKRDFVDASEIIFFKRDESLDEQRTYSIAAEKLKALDGAVIPGFYGSINDSEIHTFPRGGDDITGAIVARAVEAEKFEKWSETTEIFSADPGIVENPAIVRNVTYNELSELTYMGIRVIHEDVIMLLQKVGIPINILNIYHVNDEGTWVWSELPEGTQRKVAACIIGSRNYKSITIEKFGLNKIPGVGEKVWGAFAKRGISCEHYISGIYNFAIIVRSMMFDLKRNEVLQEIKDAIKPDNITVNTDLSIIAIIGKGMGTVKGMFAQVFDAIAEADVKVRMINQGADDLNIIIGVNDIDFEKTIRALYQVMIVDTSKK